jgi:hypothetical protein
MLLTSRPLPKPVEEIVPVEEVAIVRSGDPFRLFQVRPMAEKRRGV